MEKSVVRHQSETIYRQESRRIFATLLRLLGDFDAAEEALQEALRAATQQWPEDGLPANPRAWLISAGRFKAIDQIRGKGRKRGQVQFMLAKSIFGIDSCVKCWSKKKS